MTISTLSKQRLWNEKQGRTQGNRRLVWIQTVLSLDRDSVESGRYDQCVAQFEQTPVELPLRVD
jgi:hypothetical protein